MTTDDDPGRLRRCPACGADHDGEPNYCADCGDPLDADGCSDCGAVF